MLNHPHATLSLSMAVPADTIIDAASRAYKVERPEDVRHRLEWAWGLEYGTLDQHLADFVDPHLVAILMDEMFILIPPSELLREIFLATSGLPTSSSKPRIIIQDLYQGRKSFEYLVLPISPTSEASPRVLFSSIPPHLTICSSASKILKHWEYNFDAGRDSFINLLKTSPPPGTTFLPDVGTFINIQYVHDSWSSCYVPPRFLGLEGPDEEEESDEDAASSTMEWEIDTIEDEPQRRLLPHEFQRDPVLKIEPLPHDDDDASQDSYITGVEDPEQYVKASLARGDHEPSRTWLKGMEQWVQGASVVVDDQMLLNDGQIEEDPREQPRVAMSLDLDRPDYLSRQQTRTTT
ncbi:hypothetical protein DFH07DRAFT_795985 [Mycena maculata]|uniref:Uncharacterized protein n=1 Tax=Mycena maculata TaxID=230809 RepID=A0AAD7NX48_9AGAR|nr:hypothetical protein DFH07DRAFT_795985 [Mycena maculata]